ncbi:hypothetical protein V8F06_008972 [Rhypophila decipiens]
MARKPVLSSARTWHLFLFVNIFKLCQAEQITNGPEAPQTLYNEMAYKTGRSCAVGCLVYNGDIPCQAGAFYQDIGVWMGCGRCGQSNGCYCSTDLASSATSMIDECVSKRCSDAGVADWDQEVTKMLSLYDGYCATANVAPTTTSRVRPQATTRPPGAVTTAENPTPGAGAGSSTDGQAQETSPPSASGTSSTDEPEKKGLSQSDIVALAASLGVGIPSLLLAAITLCVQLKKRKKRNHQKLVDEGGTSVGSVAHSPQTPYRSHTTTPIPQQGHQGFNVPGPVYGYQGQSRLFGGAPEILHGGHGDGIPLQQRVFRY